MLTEYRGFMDRSTVGRGLDAINIDQEEGMRFQGLAVHLAQQRCSVLIAWDGKKDLGLDAYARAATTSDGHRPDVFNHWDFALAAVIACAGAISYGFFVGPVRPIEWAQSGATLASKSRYRQPRTSSLFPLERYQCEEREIR